VANVPIAPEKVAFPEMFMLMSPAFAAPAVRVVSREGLRRDSVSDKDAAVILIPPLLPVSVNPLLRLKTSIPLPDISPLA
jgi:hypothetical protein